MKKKTQLARGWLVLWLGLVLGNTGREACATGQPVTYNDVPLLAQGASSSGAVTNPYPSLIILPQEETTTHPVLSGMNLQKVTPIGTMLFAMPGLKNVPLTFDGLNWLTNLSTPNLNYSGGAANNGILKVNNTYVLFGGYGQLSHSTTLSNWIPCSIIYSNNPFFAAASSGTVGWVVGDDQMAITDDGTNFAEILINDVLWDCAYGNGLFVAVGDGGVVYTFTHTAGTTNYNFTGISNVSTNDATWPMGGCNGSSCLVVAQYHGIWSNSLNTNSADNTLRLGGLNAGSINATAIFFDGSQFRAVANEGYIGHSSDGNGWQTNTPPYAGAPLAAVAAGSGKCLVADDYGIYESTDWNSWTLVTNVAAGQMPYCATYWSTINALVVGTVGL